jgi:hypothetical protein
MSCTQKPECFGQRGITLVLGTVVGGRPNPNAKSPAGVPDKSTGRSYEVANVTFVQQNIVDMERTLT